MINSQRTGLRAEPLSVGIMGGSGFIGSRLAVRLIAHGHDVTVLSRDWPVPSVPGVRVPRRKREVTDNRQQPLGGLDVVVDLVSVGHWQFADSSLGRRSRHGQGPEDLVPLLEGLGVRRYVFVSSGGAVYGEWGGKPWRESDRARPMSAYGRAKLEWEREALSLATDRIDVVIARPSNAYGPGQIPQHAQGVVSAIVWASLCGGIADLWSSMESTRDYIFVDDLAEGLAQLAVNGSPGRCYNLGSETETTMTELVRILGEALEGCGYQIRVEESRRSKSGVSRSVLDCEVAKAELNWRGTRSLNVGLRETVRALVNEVSCEPWPPNDRSLRRAALGLRWSKSQAPLSVHHAAARGCL